MPRVKLGDTEVTRIGLGTNRLRRTPERIAFIKVAVASCVSLSTLPTRTPTARARRRSVTRSRPSRTALSCRRRGLSSRRRTPGGASCADRAEPSPVADGQHRALLPPPDRSSDAARGESRRDQGLSRQRQDPARRAIAGRRRPDRASPRNPADRSRPEPLQPLRAPPRGRGRLLHPRSNRVRSLLPVARRRWPDARRDRPTTRHRSRSPGCSDAPR